MRARFLSPLAAAPFVTLSGLGLFYFTFPGVSELVGTAGRRAISSSFAGAARSLIRLHSSSLQVAKCIEVGLPALVLLVLFAEVTDETTVPYGAMASAVSDGHFFFALAVRRPFLCEGELRVRAVRRAGDHRDRVGLRRDPDGGRRLQREGPRDAVQLPHRSFRDHPGLTLVGVFCLVLLLGCCAPS